MSKIISIVFATLILIMGVSLVGYHAIMGHIHGFGWLICAFFLVMIGVLFRLSLKELKEDK